MPQADLWAMLALGLVFSLLGIGAILLGRKEEADYYQAISSHRDVREFIERTPKRPEPSGLKMGGIISLVVGLALIVIGAALWIWG
jgi:hypothetical protein